MWAPTIAAPPASIIWPVTLALGRVSCALSRLGKIRIRDRHANTDLNRSILSPALWQPESDCKPIVHVFERCGWRWRTTLAVCGGDKGSPDSLDMGTNG